MQSRISILREDYIFFFLAGTEVFLQIMAELWLILQLLIFCAIFPIFFFFTLEKTSTSKCLFIANVDFQYDLVKTSAKAHFTSHNISVFHVLVMSSFGTHILLAMTTLAFSQNILDI